MNVDQIMSRNPATCSPQETLDVAAARMWDRDVGILPVVDAEGRVVAVVTDRDVAMAAYTQDRRLRELQVSVAMSKQLFACRPNDALIEAEEVMRSQQVRRLPVLDGGKLLGVISLNDLAREAEREVGHKGRQVRPDEVSATLAAIGEPRRPVELLPRN